MPLYEYRCRKCGAQVEKIQKFSDPPLTRCQECGGELERLLSSPAIQFKGAGWYVTDYARKSAPSEASKNDGDSAGSEEKKTKEPAQTGVPSEPSSSKQD